MRATRFERFTRVLSGARVQPGLPRGRSPNVTRRRAVAAMALGLLGSDGAGHDAAAEPGCKNVGKWCRRSTQCCSGICRGGKVRRCKPHDTGGCRSGQQSEACGGGNVDCTTGAGLAGTCETTTGNAGFCFRSGDCFRCRKDADCKSFRGPRVACVRCVETCSGVGGTACLGPDAGDF